MKKKVLTFLSIFLICFSTFAEQLTFNDICKNLSKTPNMTGEFIQEKKLKNASRSIKSNGKFIFCDSGLMWQTLKPFPSCMIVAKDFISQTNSKGVEKITDVSQNQAFSNIFLMFSSILNGNSEEIYKYFDVNFSSAEKTWNAVLTPKSEQIKSAIKTLELSGFIEENVFIQKMILSEHSDSITTYNFLNTKFPKELSIAEKNLFIKK